MHPYFQLGPARLAGYGLLMVFALIVALLLVRRDMRERHLHADPYMIIGITGFAGLVGAKLWHCMETPRFFLQHPQKIVNAGGFAFFGAVLGGFVALMLLAKHYRIPVLTILDMAAPAATIGYAFGRVGCFVAGDGDYGTPTSLPWGMAFPDGLVPTTTRVHPTPIYEAIIAGVIFFYLWSLRTKAFGGLVLQGRIFAVYLVMSGVARFTVEFIRVNPRVLWGLSNAQFASFICILAGVVLYTYSRAGPLSVPWVRSTRGFRRRSGERGGSVSRGRHTEAEMIGGLKQMEPGHKAEDVARENQYRAR